METVRPGIYRHFKGRDYEVLGEFTHTETQEVFVAYAALYAPYRRCVRPKAMFIEEVGRPELGYKGRRFTLIRAH